MSQSSDSDHVASDDKNEEDANYDPHTDDANTEAEINSRTGAEETNGLERQRVEEERDLERVRNQFDLQFVKVAAENGARRFEAWTSLLDFAEKIASREPKAFSLARAAYERFLTEFPYCFGYWNKLAEFIAHHGSKSQSPSGLDSANESNAGTDQTGGKNASAVFQVFERAVRAVPISVELWIFYATFAEREWRETIALIDSVEEYESRMRALLERALRCCAMEPKAEKLWDRFFEFEVEHGRFNNVVALLDRALEIPCSFASDALDRFQRLVAAHHPRTLLAAAEYESLAHEVRTQLHAEVDVKARAASGASSGETDAEIEDNASAFKSNQVDANHVDDNDDHFVELVRARCIESRRSRFERIRSDYDRRAAFETPLRRSFFHVKPLESAQLAAWRTYLDFEIAALTDSSTNAGDATQSCTKIAKFERVLFLYERCCVTTAMYDQFWLDYIDFLYTYLLDDSRIDAGKLTDFPFLQHLFDAHAANHELNSAASHPDAPAGSPFAAAPPNRFEVLKTFARNLLAKVAGELQLDSRCVTLLRSVCERALVHVGHRPFVYLRLGELFERLGHASSACCLLETAVRDAFGDNLAVRLAFIDTLRRAGQRDAVDCEFERIIGANVQNGVESQSSELTEHSAPADVPQDTRRTADQFSTELRSAVALKYAKYLLFDGHPDRSLEVLRRAVTADPASLRLRYALIDTLMQTLLSSTASKQRDVVLESVHETFSAALNGTDLSAESKLDLASRYVELCQTVCTDTRRIDAARGIVRRLQRDAAVRHTETSTRRASFDGPAAKRARLTSGDAKRHTSAVTATSPHWNPGLNAAATASTNAWDPTAVASYYGSYGYTPYAYGTPYQPVASGAVPPWPAAGATYGYPS